ncbi:MAG: hypothetical protein FMNOHCHN_00905 [Ignavibacteriaceae bacterium]|nr:hypothetical protein [Ignavibacteriaceae bacterium]
MPLRRNNKKSALDIVDRQLTLLGRLISAIAVLGGVLTVFFTILTYLNTDRAVEKIEVADQRLRDETKSLSDKNEKLRNDYADKLNTLTTDQLEFQKEILLLQNQLSKELDQKFDNLKNQISPPGELELLYNGIPYANQDFTVELSYGGEDFHGIKTKNILFYLKNTGGSPVRNFKIYLGVSPAIYTTYPMLTNDTWSYLNKENLMGTEDQQSYVNTTLGNNDLILPKDHAIIEIPFDVDIAHKIAKTSTQLKVKYLLKIHSSFSDQMIYVFNVTFIKSKQ